MLYKNRMAITVLLVLVLSIFYMPMSVLAVDSEANDVSYSIVIRSTAQVNSGGIPEYVIIDSQNNEVGRYMVDSIDGTTIKVDSGDYWIKEVRTAKGFVPFNKDYIKVSLPHIDENGNSFTKVIVEMKSSKYEKPESDNAESNDSNSGVTINTDSGTPNYNSNKDKNTNSKEIKNPVLLPVRDKNQSDGNQPNKNTNVSNSSETKNTDNESKDNDKTDNLDKINDKAKSGRDTDSKDYDGNKSMSKDKSKHRKDLTNPKTGDESFRTNVLIFSATILAIVALAVALKKSKSK